MSTGMSQCRVMTMSFPGEATGVGTVLEYVTVDHTKINYVTKTYIVDGEPHTVSGMLNFFGNK